MRKWIKKILTKIHRKKEMASWKVYASVLHQPKTRAERLQFDCFFEYENSERQVNQIALYRDGVILETKFETGKYGMVRLFCVDDIMYSSKAVLYELRANTPGHAEIDIERVWGNYEEV